MSKYRHYQSGITLLLMLFLLIGLGATFLLFALPSTKPQLTSDSKTQLALKQAKEAVIAWSTTHPTTPGYLPCPEDTTLIGFPYEGRSLSNCSTSMVLTGRLPWRTLGLDKQTDASGEPLWYVLSPGFRSTAPSGTQGIPQGQLPLDGVSNGIAALIIAPGPPLTGQTRPPVSVSAPPQAFNYLDLGNATGNFVSTGPSASYNDQVIAITTQELYQAMSFRVLAEIRGAFALQNGLRHYYSVTGNFPPAGSDLSTLMFDADTQKWLSPISNPGLWFSQVTYTPLSPNLVQLRIGKTNLAVLPCTTIPCQ